MATGSPFGSDRNGMDADPEIRIRENRILSGIFFSLFSLLRTPWDLRVTPRRFPYHLIRIRTGKSGFFENPDFSFFRLFKLKDTLQYGCLWTPLDQPKSPVLVLRYLTVLYGTFLVLNGTFSVLSGWSAWSGMSAWTQVHMPYLMIYT